MSEFTEAYGFQGRTLVDRNGRRIGTVDEILGDADWAVVRTGPRGTGRAAVPLAGATPRGEDVEVAVNADAVRDAPPPEAGEAALRRHYGFEAADDAMTRSEEELRVTTAWHARERVRVRKVVVTEHVTIPVRREELRVERIPAGDDDAAATASAERPPAEPDLEMVLYEERPVIETRVVPRERVRVRVETVRGSERIDDELRAERVGLDTHPDRRKST